MKKLVLGIDPDAAAHGVAFFLDGCLYDLRKMSLVDLYLFLEANKEAKQITVGMENVLANKFMYGRNEHAHKAAQSKIASNVGRCQQAQYELQQVLEHHGIPYVLFRPGGGNWAKNPALFQKATGWTGSSNEDTRSAAFFGFQILDRHVTANN